MQNKDKNSKSIRGIQTLFYMLIYRILCPFFKNERKGRFRGVSVLFYVDFGTSRFRFIRYVGNNFQVGLSSYNAASVGTMWASCRILF